MGVGVVDDDDDDEGGDGGGCEDDDGGVGGAEKDQGRAGLGVILWEMLQWVSVGDRLLLTLCAPPSPLVSYFWV